MTPTIIAILLSAACLLAVAWGVGVRFGRKLERRASFDRGVRFGSAVALGQTRTQQKAQAERPKTAEDYLRDYQKRAAEQMQDARAIGFGRRGLDE